MAKDAEYTLTIAQDMVNITGKPVRAMTINGHIPGPTLELTEGDKATIHVQNNMDVETSIHWHGILLPNREDGVSYLTTPPILPHSSYTFQFSVIQSGTYWYHSHTMLQEQSGVLGSIVIHPKPGESEHYPTRSALDAQEGKPEATAPRSHHHHHDPSALPKIDQEAVVVLSDWTNEDPHHVLKNLKRGTDWYGVKKGTKQSVIGAFQRKVVWQSLKRSFTRMPPMDLSDVAYDAFLINGQRESLGKAKAGETVRLRVINASASTYFYFNYGGGDMTVIAADGQRVQPIAKDRLLMAIAETYDVLIKVPETGMAEFRATAQDGSGKASYWLGSGEKLNALDIPKPNMYLMAHDMHAMGDMNHMSHTAHQNTESHEHESHSMADMDMSPVSLPTDTPQEARPFAPYHELKALVSTALPNGRPLREYTFHLNGDMVRYIWTINGKTLSEADVIRVKRGENVRFNIINDTMMHHPMHLHGHYFRVVNELGDYSPLKHTVDVPPMGQRVIEFAANEEKDWFFHCHVLYHMKTGMHQIMSYEDSTPDPDILASRHMLYHDHFYLWGEASLLSNMTEGRLNASNTRNTFQARWEYDWRDQFDTELTYDRYINRFLQVFAGTNLVHENHEPVKARGIAGARYLMPFMVFSTAWVDNTGNFRIMADKRIFITRRLAVFGEFEYDTKTQFEWAAGASLLLSQTFSLYGQYHSDYGAGAGLQIRF